MTVCGIVLSRYRKKNNINVSRSTIKEATDLRFVMYFWEIGFSSPYRYLRR